MLYPPSLAEDLIFFFLFTDFSVAVLASLILYYMSLYRLFMLEVNTKAFSASSPYRGSRNKFACRP